MNIEKWRVWIFYILMAGILGFYVLRLLDYQLVNGQNYAEAALDQRKNVISEPTQRGIIYDRNGYILAHNVPSYDLVITPAYLPEDEGETQELYRQISALTGIPVNKGNIEDENVIKGFKPCDNDLGISQIVYIANTNWPFQPVQIQCNINESIAMIVNEKSVDWPGVGILVTPVRDYPSGSITSEIVGFLGPIPAALKDEYEDLGFDLNRDKIGYAGIEATMDEYLAGRNGRRVVEVDVAGKSVRDLETPEEPIPGNNITLTIDTRLQRAARDALISVMADINRQYPQYGLSNGVVIAMNPKTGEILSLVSFPNFENNLMERQIPAYYYEQLQRDPNRPLFNHAISAEHPPGSVYKLAASIGILNEDVVTVDQLIDDPGKITIQERFLENETGRSRDYVCYLYKQGGSHGKLDFLSGLAESCDVYFYKVGGGYENEVPKGLGIWRLGEYSRALGYGEVTGIELPGEADGLIPDPTWKRLTIGENWSTGDTYIATIGQGYVLATPIQVLVSAATIANDGKMMKPTLIKQIVDSDGTVIKDLEPTLVRDITTDPVITVYDENNFATDQKIPVEAWVVQKVKEGMRKVVVDGTARDVFEGMAVQSAGKTGTAEYCDNVAQAKGSCDFGLWPSHAWYVGYAPYNDPEIVVVAFVYNGSEGSLVAAPIVRKVMEAYFCLESTDPATCP